MVPLPSAPLLFGPPVLSGIHSGKIRTTDPTVAAEPELAAVAILQLLPCPQAGIPVLQAVLYQRPAARLAIGLPPHCQQAETLDHSPGLPAAAPQ
jgi:hypothetical protein